jgi:hypothetical protein
VGHGQRAREVGEEDGARLERRDEQRFAARVGLCQLLPELGNPAADLLAGQVDVPDGVSVCRQGGS